MKILVCPDKFKGSLSAIDAAAAIANGLGSVLTTAEIVTRPVADGGEGTADVLCEALAGTWRTLQVLGPVGDPITARYCLSQPEGGDPVAVIEMSEASGMRRLDKLDPMRASTFGTGELISAAAAAGAKEIIVGLGGSATNDGGLGMAAALGYRFLDKGGSELEPLVSNLGRIDRIIAPRDLRLPSVIAAVDVQNPLLGPEGATYAYGRQKGIRGDQFQELEAGLQHFAAVVERDLGRGEAATEGAGAAGGLGFGLLCFCNATIEPGFDLIARAMDLEKAIAWADLIVTAEGRMDSQTLRGKAPLGVSRMARSKGKPVVALAGSVSDEEALNAAFDAIIPIPSGPMELDEAIARAGELLTRAAARVARVIRLS